MYYNTLMRSLNYVRGIQMQFDTCHEYYLNDPCIHYCEDHDVLMITNHGRSTDRLMINGITKDVVNRLRLELNKEALENVTDQEVPA